MQGSAARLTPWTEGTTINGKHIVHRSPGVRKTGRVILAFLCAFCILPPPNGESASGRKQASRGAKGSLGTVEFRVSCTPAAQKYFTRGVALVHSFTYEESAEAFRGAAAQDSPSSMAHSGLPMTAHHQ